MGNNIFRALMFALLLFTVTHVSSANSFYANALEVSPGEVEELSFMLDNEQEFIGFQFDLVLPEGLEAVLDGDAVRCSLSGRADDTYSLFSNVLADGTVRIGAFSVQNNPFRGNSGSLLNVALRSSDSFAGGTLQIRNIRFVDVNNNDVILPNTSCAVTPRSIFVESLVMSQTELSLREGQTATLSVNVLPDNAENKGVTWSSSNDAVATVSADGLVTAISLGEAIVTATAADGSGVTATCRVTVGATLAEGVSVSADGETTLKVGGSVQLRATVTPETATDKSVSWSTGNANVATVDGNGLVTAVGVGTATITCTNSAGLTATIDITVERTPVSSITLNRETAALRVSGTIQLSATVLPETATDKTVTWSSSDDAVATVSGDGLVTATAIGEALITATAADGSGVTATCRVTVGATPAEGVSITADGETTLKVGGTAQLRATVTPDAATDKSVSWSTGNANVATVDGNGLVTAVGVGTATITCTNSAGQTATIDIIVEPTLVTSISLDRNTATMNAGESFALVVTILPEDATDKSVTWKSSNDGVATVSVDGVVTAVGAGTADVTATANDGSGVSATCSIIVNEAKAYDFFVDGLYYTITSNTERTVGVTYNNGHDYSGDIVIPSTVEWEGVQYNVTSICKQAFNRCDIASVSIPGSVKTIGDNAFSNADELLSIVFEEGLETIGYQAFAWCDNLREVKLPTSLRVLEYGAFAVSGLTEIELPEGLADIGEFAFYDCRQLRKVRVPSTVTQIRDKAFLQCFALETFDLHNGVATIGVNAFGAWESIKEFICGSSLPIDIDENVFMSPMNYDGLDFSTCVLYVPRGSVSAYREAPVWSKFMNIRSEGMVYSISLDVNSLTLDKGDVATLTATVLPEDADNKGIIWSSSDETVATVSAAGEVTALSLGEAVITATAAGGSGVTASCTVTVGRVPVASVLLDKSEATLNAGESLALAVTILPEDATDKSVTWTSSNDDVATVSSDGVVTAVGAGTADVTATANDGSGLSATCVVTVKEQVTISWEQTIEAVVGDVVTLEAEASNGAPIAFRTVRTAGGYVTPVVTYADGEWTATFPATGAVILEAYIESEDGTAVCEPVRKAFNVLPDRDVMLIDGIYYRYTDNTHSALTVTYGYRQYEGDVIVPSVAGGLPVVSVGNRAFYSNVGLVSVTLSEGLERIESDQAFGNSPNLSSVVIPSTVSYIGSYTFNVDKGLSEIHCRVKKPSGLALFGGEDIFNGFVDYDNCILYVPSGTAEAYREADVWRNFKNIVEEQPEPVLVALLSLDDDEIELNVGETATLRTVVYPSSATNQSVEWTSSDEAVATVDAGGEVLAVGQGTAVVTATTVDGSGLSASCAVTVNLPSGISAVGLDGVRIVTDNGRIVITGLSADDIISVYTISGSLVYRGANRPVTVQAPGVYLVSIKGHTYKVVVK